MGFPDGRHRYAPSRSLVVGNNIGLNTGGGGQFLTYGDNRIDGNFTNICGPCFTTTALK